MPATGVQGRPHTELQLCLVVVPNWGFEASVRFLRVSWFNFSLFTFMAKLLLVSGKSWHIIGFVQCEPSIYPLPNYSFTKSSDTTYFFEAAAIPPAASLPATASPGPEDPMTTYRMTACVLLIAVCVLAGCGGLQTTASNPTPSPSPTTPPSTPPPPGTPLPPSFPTEFVYTADASTITSFKINSDGSLSAPVTAATVALPEIVKGLGTSLITNSGLFAVNPATGALQLQDSQPFFFTDAVTDIFPDPSGVTFHGNSSLALHFPPLNSFSIATGHVALVQQITGGQGWFQMLASDPEGKFVYTANQPGGNRVGFSTLLAVLPRNACGTEVGTPVEASERPMLQQDVSQTIF